MCGTVFEISLKFLFAKCVFLLYFLGFAVESGVLALPTR